MGIVILMLGTATIGGYLAGRLGDKRAITIFAVAYVIIIAGVLAVAVSANWDDWGQWAGFMLFLAAGLTFVVCLFCVALLVLLGALGVKHRGQVKPGNTQDDTN